VTLGGALRILACWPVSSLPQVDFPTIQVNDAVARRQAPVYHNANLSHRALERQAGQIPALATMTSSSSKASARSPLQFMC